MEIIIMHDLHSICQKAVELWGVESQVLMAMEEAGELVQALSKYIRYNRQAVDGLVEEIADVEIMIEQLKQILGATRYEIEAVKEYKIRRLAERIKLAELERKR